MMLKNNRNWTVFASSGRTDSNWTSAAGIVGGVGNILRVRSEDFMGVCVCQNESNGSLKTYAFFLYVNFISSWKNKKHGKINSLQHIKTFIVVVSRRQHPSFLRLLLLGLL